MACLLDLPPAVRRELAERWQTEDPATPTLYRVITDPTALAIRLGELDPVARQMLDLLAGAPLSLDDLLTRLPASREKIEAELDRLTRLAVVLQLSPGGGPPRLARPPFTAGSLYVPPDVARALIRAGRLE